MKALASQLCLVPFTIARNLLAGLSLIGKMALFSESLRKCFIHNIAGMALKQINRFDDLFHLLTKKIQNFHADLNLDSDSVTIIDVELTEGYVYEEPNAAELFMSLVHHLKDREDRDIEISVDVKIKSST